MTPHDRIGVGRITCGNRRLKGLRLPEGCIVAEVHDKGMRGPAWARNQALKRLMDADCDFMFLFDDDCYPIMDGWAEYFIEQHKLTGVHFLGLPEAFKSVLRYQGPGEVLYWSNIIGCFNFQTRKFMEIVGYYGPEFQGYGYEDSARNARAMRSSLVGPNHGMFPSLLRAPSYIFSEDVYARDPIPNMSVEAKAAGIKRNLPHCLASNASSKLYQPFPAGA